MSTQGLLAAEDDNNEKNETSYHRLPQRPSRRLTALLSSFIFFMGCLAGCALTWLFNRYLLHSSVQPYTVPQVPVGRTVEVFGSHTEFMGPPPSDNSTEPSWDSLLPKGLGYVSSADTDHNVSTIGAFHQLHCLYTLRRIYYATVAESQEAAQEEHTLASFDNGVERTEHADHCFEYLRQALMCNADSSLEPFEGRQAAFPGMGFPRQCQDYAALKLYAEKYRIMDAQGFIYKGPNIDDHGGS